ncbi:MAG: rod shape-determining protein [Pyrinomonadaceae bacterium]|nr:rod shape-determining protein [Pyrinomonadaceae bacterium]
MSIISNFFSDDLAVDLGTVNTVIFAPGAGIVLNEPSAVAINKFTGEVLAVGGEAYKLIGREPHDTEVFRPVRNGTIDNFEAAEKMLAAFIRRAHGDRNRRSRLVVGVPGASTTLEQRSVRDAARDAKAARVDLVDEGLAAALGAGLSFENEKAHLVVDIGGGTTNVAVVASNAVVSSTSVTAAGNKMDEAIQSFVRSKYEMQIGERTAEEVKKELGTSAPQSGEPTGEAPKLEVIGKGLKDGMAKVVMLSSDEVREALEPVITEIIASVRRAIEESQPDVTADIYRTGILLSGGGALLTGLAERLQSELRLHVTVADEPLMAVATGAGRLLAHSEWLQRVALRQDAPAWQASEELVVNW